MNNDDITGWQLGTDPIDPFANIPGCATNFGPTGRRPHIHQLDGGGVCIVDACMFGLDDVED